MGGRYTFADGDTYAHEQQLYNIDLNTSFPVEDFITSTILGTVAQPPAEPQSQWQGSGLFFPDPAGTTLYAYAGFLNDNKTYPGIWAYDTLGNTWSNVSVAGDNLNSGNPSYAESMSASSTSTGLGLSFTTGGWTPTHLPAMMGMVVFNASDPGNPSWINETGPDVPQTQGSTMEYVRYGKQGVLIGIGGFNNFQFEQNPKGANQWFQRRMENIMVYDVDSSTWFNVTAFGDIPPPRSEMCSSVAASPDDSSFQITIYGGADLTIGTVFDDVWILTIPTFRWIKVGNGTNNAESQLPLGNSTIGRTQMNCETYKDRQMIVLGGEVQIRTGDQTTQLVNQQSCDPSYPAIRVLDTSTFTFQTEFNPMPPAYVVPDLVSAAIGGGASGGATAKTPNGGWNNTQLEQIFSQTIKAVNVTTDSKGGSDSTASSQTSSSSSSNQSSGSSTGAIVGGVVGGVAGAAIAVGLYLFLRSRKQKRLQTGDGYAMVDHKGFRSEADGNFAVHEAPADHVRHEMDNGYQESMYPGGDHAVGGPVEVPATPVER
ncbi:MAG: hypothetical protein M1827_003403 [Pycnora praestabilis]|nr:MAG: hypothetical protein M1827_003403 [Pycnora praestabilis]